MNEPFDTAISFLCEPAGTILYHLPCEVKESTCEIRCRINRPVCLVTEKGVFFLHKNGTLKKDLSDDLLTMNKIELENSFRSLCRDSVYAFEEEIRQGFLTYLSGHRIGISGTAIVKNGKIETIKDITSLNIRIARETVGLAAKLADKLGARLLHGVLLAGRPGCGKTTMLRDLCRILASPQNGNPYQLAVIDEREELAAVFQGEPQLNVGICSDILDRYPKGEGIRQAVRCFAPDIIVCDELGSEEEAWELIGAVNAGVSVIATIHAGDTEELCRRPQFQMLQKNNVFQTVVFMENRDQFGEIREILNADELVC